MWFSVGSSNDLIDDMGQVGMSAASNTLTVAYRSGCNLRQTTSSGAADGKANHGGHGGDEERVALAEPWVEHSGKEREAPSQHEDVVQQRGQGRAAELKTCAPAAGHIAEPNRKQCEYRDRCDDDRKDRIEDRLAGDGAAHLQDLLHVHCAEPVLQVGLHVGLLRRAERWVANDVATVRGLDHG